MADMPVKERLIEQAKILRHCGLWEGPLRTLATARAPPKEGDTDQELAEPRELQLVLDPEYL